MLLQRFEVPGLSQYSYLLASGGQAIAIDPKRDVDTYLDFAFAQDLKITHVLETHIHADFASGATALAEKTGAQIWVSAYDEGEEFQYKFDHRPFREGEEISFGDLRVQAIHTPGHTPEHLSFLVFEKNRCGQPLALFSGDFIFVGSLGRPDLLGEGAKEKLAGALFDSVHAKISSIPDGTMIMPGHGAGSLCGAGMSERPESTLGYERHCNVFVQGTEKPEFVKTILDSVPQFPPYYRRMKELNSQGPRLLERLPGDAAFSPHELSLKLGAGKSLLLDTRSPDAFGGAHIPDSFNIGEGPNLSLWSGWVLPYNEPIYLVGDARSDLDEIRRSLVRVGHDNIAGYLKDGMEKWLTAGLQQAHVPQISVSDLKTIAEAGGFVLDVRSPKEWEAGHIEGARHIAAGDLPDCVRELPSDVPLHVICGSGYRSSIACSLLLRAGYKNLFNTVGGMTAWAARKYPAVR